MEEPGSISGIPVQQVAGERGLVWSIEDILRLRKHYRLIGCMVGGIARYQSQVAVLGLPLQLSPEEVSLAAAAGWIRLYQTSFSIPTAAAAAAAEPNGKAGPQNLAPSPPAAAAAASAGNPPSTTISQQQGQQHVQGQQQQEPGQQQQQGQQEQQQQQQQQQYDPMQVDEAEELDEFYAAYYGLELPQAKQQQQHSAPQHLQQQQHQGQAAVAVPSAQQQNKAQEEMEQQQQQQQQQKNKQKQKPQELQPWQRALKSSNRFAIPLTIFEAAAATAGLDSSSSGTVAADAAAGGTTAAACTTLVPNSTSHNQQQQRQQQQQQGWDDHCIPLTGESSSFSSMGSPYCRCEPVCWQYPCSALQWLRLAVFSDLYSRGFSVTGGAKFGGDFLAYPGDPHLYHAQYVIRVLLPDTVLVHSVLQGLARGVHAARKLLVLATVQPPEPTAAAAAGGAAEGRVTEGQAAGGIERAAVETAAAVGGLRVTRGIDAAAAGGEGGNELTAAAGAVAAAATLATCEAVFQGLDRKGPLQLGAPASAAAVGLSGGGVAAKPVGVLKYITMARETGWGAE